MNVATPLDSGRLLGAIGTTLESAFAHVRFTRLPSGQPVESTILYASAAPLAMPPPERVPELLRPVGLALHPIDVPERHRRILTDDHAPIEWLTDLALVEAVWP
jgi:hypothetical protein